MSPLTVRCIRFAFLSLLMGIGLGVLFAFDRGLGARARHLHAELNLWGWTTLLIYGMAYHMVPRFAGRPLRWPRVAEAQSWLAAGGVMVAVLGWTAWVGGASWARIPMLVGGAMQVAAAGLFVLLAGDILRRATTREPLRHGAQPSENTVSSRSPATQQS